MGVGVKCGARHGMWRVRHGGKSGGVSMSSSMLYKRNVPRVRVACSAPVILDAF